ncbi:hypothetical protein D3C71_1296370 [compost metagenome]
MAGGENQRRSDTAQRQGQFEIRSSGEGGGNARNDLVTDTGIAQCRHFLSRPAIDQRITGFEAHDALAVFTKTHQQAVDLILRLAVAALAFADGQPLGVAAPHVNDCLRH